MLRIDAQGLTKEFKSHKSRPGLKGAFRDLLNREYQLHRAVDEVSLQVNEGEWWVISGKMEPESLPRLKCLQASLCLPLGIYRSTG